MSNHDDVMDAMSVTMQQINTSKAQLGGMFPSPQQEMLHLGGHNAAIFTGADIVYSAHLGSIGGPGAVYLDTEALIRLRDKLNQLFPLSVEQVQTMMTSAVARRLGE